MTALLLCGGMIAVTAVAGACAGSPAPASSGNVLAPAPTYSDHPTIDNIPCETMERVVYHVHAHLAVFIDGQPKVVPDGVGIAAPRQLQNSQEGPFVASGGCFYWLHTHTADGVIHVEAPVPMQFTLGQFFDVWQQPLRNTLVGPAQGNVVAYLNSEPYQGDVRDIPLAAHDLIQLDLRQDVAPQPFTFPAGL